MIRLFIGLALPAALCDRLAMLSGGVPGARWVPPENMHMTLRFVGEVEHTMAEDVDAALSRVRTPAFDLLFNDVGKFETGRKPRAIWVGVERNPMLERLHGKIESAAIRLGLGADPRKFAPHVTLARMRDAQPERVAAFLAANSLFRFDNIHIDRFTLFSSRLGRSGPVYRAEAEYDLDPEPIPANGDPSKPRTGPGPA